MTEAPPAGETAGMRALIDLEDAAPDVLFEKIAGTDDQFWPLLRWPLSRSVAEVDIQTTPVRGRRSRARAIADVVRSRLPNARAVERVPAFTPHLFIVDGGTRIPTQQGSINWLTDDFAAALGENAIVLQDRRFDRFTSRPDRPALPRTYTFGTALSRIEYRTRLAPLATAERSRLRSIAEEIVRRLPFAVPSELQERAVTQALRRADRVPHVNHEFDRVIDRVRPHHIYMQTAAYGDRSNVIRAAHDAGVHVAELQHGWIGASHAAYNFGRAASDDRLKRCLPDTLLTFGEYWGRAIRFPGRVIALGKPQLDAAASRAPKITARPREVLLVSSNYRPEELIRVATWLRRALPEDWTIVLRPHPAERPIAKERYAAALDIAGIRLDRVADAAAALARSRAVVGFASTVLFEALAFDVHVAVIESGLAAHYAPKDVFSTRIDDEATAAEFTRLIDTPPAPPDDAIRESVWCSDPITHFLAEVGR